MKGPGAPSHRAPHALLGGRPPPACLGPTSRPRPPPAPAARLDPAFGSRLLRLISTPRPHPGATFGPPPPSLFGFRARLLLSRFSFFPPFWFSLRPRLRPPLVRAPLPSASDSSYGHGLPQAPPTAPPVKLGSGGRLRATPAFRVSALGRRHPPSPAPPSARLLVEESLSLSRALSFPAFSPAFQAPRPGPAFLFSPPKLWTFPKRG